MQTIKYGECPLCLSGHFDEYTEVKDYSVSKEVFPINECKDCGLLFTDEVPSKENIGPYYRSDAYISHTNKANNFINKLYKFARNFTIKQKIKLVRRYNGKSILDIGSGTGIFLERAMACGYEIKGVETDQTARNNQPQSIDPHVVTSISTIEDTASFDIITMWHVLEHIHDIREEFSSIIKHLNINGHIIIAVPNPSSWDAQHYGKKWAAWDVPRHLYHFRRKQIEYLYKEFNLSLVSIQPMKLDSFYVSMLSEKYKGAPTILQLIKGFIYGNISNFKAGKNNHSSLIYIGRKNA